MLLAFVKSLTDRARRRSSADGEGSAVEEPAAGEEPMAQRSDEALMLAYKGGDVAAFEILVRRHERPVYNFILRSTGRKDTAEELLQEVFLRIVRSAPKYEQSAKFTTWAYTIARNLCIDRARKYRNRREYSLNNPVGGADAAGGASFQDQLVDEAGSAAPVEYERKIFLARLREALDELPEDQREVFVMREVSGLKFREIAEILECPVPTVKSRMRYALEALRGHMAAYEGHSFDAEEERVTAGADGE